MKEAPNQEQSNNHYLVKLEEEMEMIKSALHDFLIETSETGDDIAEVQEARDQQNQIIANYKERQVEIERALRWIKKNGYVCAVCRQPISQARLEADPASITCREHLDQEDTIEI